MFHPSTVKPETFKVLMDLFKIPLIKNNFALAGGTSLALQIGHRDSVDLDLFTNTSFNIEEVKNLLQLEENLDFTLIGQNSSMLFAYINDVKCDFVREPSKRILPYGQFENLNLFSIEDICAMKLHTICGRGKKKDFFDVYALLQLYSWEEMLQWFELKYSSSQYYFLWKSIDYFVDADNDPDIKGFKPFTNSWNEIKKIIKENCTNTPNS